MMDFLGELSEDGFPRVYISDLDEDGTYEDTEFDLVDHLLACPIPFLYHLFPDCLSNSECHRLFLRKI
jgi:hypothetical protein